jgi:hypothetical protein
MRQFVIQQMEAPLMFAIITFRSTGPIKTWSAMRAANVHNARTKPLDHAVPGVPGPRHLIGGRDLVADVRRRLTSVGIDPDQLRRNGVIAYEAILTASAEFFDAGAEEERRQRLEAWTAEQVRWAKDRYGAHRVVSMVLHVDEKTPHVHLVVLPLDVKSDGRRSDDGLRWSLVGRLVSGPGKFDEAQDAYSAAMARFGLVRGVRGSGRKHEPVPVYLARMAAKEADVDAAASSLRSDTAAVGMERDRLAVRREMLDARETALIAARAKHDEALRRAAHEAEQERVAVAGERAALAADRRRLKAARVALEKEKAEHAAIVAEAHRRLVGDRNVLDRQQATSQELREQLLRKAIDQRSEVEAAKKDRRDAAAERLAAANDREEAAAMKARAQATSDNIDAHHTSLAETFQAAARFRERLQRVGASSLTQAASSTRAAVQELAVASARLRPPPTETRPQILGVYERMRQAGAGLA